MEKFNLCCCAYHNGHLLSWLKESALEADLDSVAVSATVSATVSLNNFLNLS